MVTDFFTSLHEQELHCSKVSLVKFLERIKREVPEYISGAHGEDLDFSLFLNSSCNYRTEIKFASWGISQIYNQIASVEFDIEIRNNDTDSLDSLNLSLNGSTPDFYDIVEIQDFGVYNPSSIEIDLHNQKITLK